MTWSKQNTSVDETLKSTVEEKNQFFIKENSLKFWGRKEFSYNCSLKK